MKCDKTMIKRFCFKKKHTKIRNKLEHLDTKLYMTSLYCNSRKNVNPWTRQHPIHWWYLILFQREMQFHIMTDHTFQKTTVKATRNSIVRVAQTTGILQWKVSIVFNWEWEYEKNNHTVTSFTMQSLIKRILFLSYICFILNKILSKFEAYKGH